MMFEYTVYITLILNAEIGLSYVTFRDREKCVYYMSKVDPLLWTDAYCYKMYKFKDTLPLPASRPKDHMPLPKDREPPKLSQPEKK